MKPSLPLVYLLLMKFLLAENTTPDSDILAPEYRLNGSLMSKALGTKKELILQSTVGLYRNDKLIAHGIIVDPKGLLVTKASSSVGARIVKNFNDESFPIRIRKRDETTDLSLWQISPSSFSWSAVELQEELNQTKYGNWVVCAGENLEELMFGVISATGRSIGREGGVMGVLLEETNSSESGIEVLEVLPQAAGDRAGLKIFDKIIRVDGRQVKATQQINRIIKDKDPGDLLTLLINRKNKQILLRLTLWHRSVAFDLYNRNLLKSGPVSKRKDNFSQILQHDLPLKKEMMGGGLYDLAGNFLGINIARVDRVTNFTLPCTVVLPTVEKWLKEIR